jgi:hypothetical protein
MSVANAPAQPPGVTNVIGRSVKDSGGRRLGQIADVVRDRASNGILFAVVAVGAALQVAERYQPIAWNALSYSGVDDAYVVKDT